MQATCGGRTREHHFHHSCLARMWHFRSCASVVVTHTFCYARICRSALAQLWCVWPACLAVCNSTNCKRQNRCLGWGESLVMRSRCNLRLELSELSRWAVELKSKLFVRSRFGLLIISNFLYCGKAWQMFLYKTWKRSFIL